MFRARFVAGCVLSLTLRLPAGTLIVDGAGAGDFIDIQSAVDSAADGDTVIVKPGEYVITEPIDFNRLHDPENPTSPPVKNIVLRSEGGAAATTIRMAAAPANPGRASVIVFESGETQESMLDGFTITGGRGTTFGGDEWTGGGQYGGGLLCVGGASPLIRSCSIVSNLAGAMGGGGVACLDGSAPTFLECTISRNRTGEDADMRNGGGVLCEGGSDPTLTACTISRNSADSGGGVSIHDSSPTIQDCTISGNAAAGGWDCCGSGSGGGVYCIGDSSPTITGCVITGNSSAGGMTNAGGGGVCCVGGSPTLAACLISGNECKWFGGGLYCLGSSPTVTSCIISDNNWPALYPWPRCGLACMGEGSSPSLVHCTISGNADGGLLCIDGSTPSLRNSVVHGNRGASIVLARQWSSDIPGNPAVTYCSIEGDPVWPGAGNSNRPPLFVRPGHLDGGGTPEDPTDDVWIPGDYRLQPGSPCIDAGTPESAPTTDIEGRARPCGAGVDIGAYEFGDCEVVPLRFRRADSNADGTLDVSDAMAALGYLFLGTEVLSCLAAADADDSGALDLSDAIYSLGYQFLGGPAPPEPFGGCGVDPTGDDLTCGSYAGCP